MITVTNISRCTWREAAAAASASGCEFLQTRVTGEWRRRSDACYASVLTGRPAVMFAELPRAMNAAADAFLSKERTLHMLRQIKGLGVTIAIDDFGTGYFSLDTLRSFPFDGIKLDRSFVSEVGQCAQAKAIVRAVLALGKSLEISVLAEGVETADQLAVLQSEGWDKVQGFLLGRPRRMPQTEIEAGLAFNAAHLQLKPYAS